MAETPSTKLDIKGTGDHLIEIETHGMPLCRILVTAKEGKAPAIIVTGKWKVGSNTPSVTVLEGKADA